jgi:hypothetical protein
MGLHFLAIKRYLVSLCQNGPINCRQYQRKKTSPPAKTWSVFDELPALDGQPTLKSLLETMLYGVLCKINHSDSADHNAHRLLGRAHIYLSTITTSGTFYNSMHLCAFQIIWYCSVHHGSCCCLNMILYFVTPGVTLKYMPRKFMQPEVVERRHHLS